MTRAEINSFNAGYHRGLHTEYLDEDPKAMFERWVLDGRRDVTDVDFGQFERGLKEGRADADWKSRVEL